MSDSHRCFSSGELSGMIFAVDTAGGSGGGYQRSVPKSAT